MRVFHQLAEMNWKNIGGEGKLGIHYRAWAVSFVVKIPIIKLQNQCVSLNTETHTPRFESGAFCFVRLRKWNFVVNWHGLKDHGALFA